MDSYSSPLQANVWEQLIEKSRFIGLVYPVRTLAEVNVKLEHVRQEYPNARHYVYAYRLFGGKQEKSTDDGEPQGTGGKPVLDALQHLELWNVLLVVVRYFGGVLLGTGGLGRAYGSTARQLLDTTELGRVVQHAVFGLAVPYSWYETLKYQLRLKAWVYEQEVFGEYVELEVLLPQEQASAFGPWLDNLTSRQVEWSFKGMSWRPQEY